MYGHRTGIRTVHRRHTEIANSVLLACLNGALGTHVMFRCNLNSKQLRSYLDLLHGRGLVEKRTWGSAKVGYFTTEKGRRFIETYNSLQEMLENPQPIAS